MVTPMNLPVLRFAIINPASSPLSLSQAAADYLRKSDHLFTDLLTLGAQRTSLLHRLRTHTSTAPEWSSENISGDAAPIGNMVCYEP